MVAKKKDPVETKVWAGVSGTAAGATISAFLIWLLGVTVWDAPSDADSAQSAVGAVPVPVSALVALVVLLLFNFLSMYIAPHTYREPVDPDAPDPVYGTDPGDAGVVDADIGIWVGAICLVILVLFALHDHW